LIPMSRNYDPSSKGLPLTNTAGDVELEVDSPNCRYHANQSRVEGIQGQQLSADDMRQTYTGDEYIM
jgi:hypothetical protein